MLIENWIYFVYLLLGIITETIATSSLKYTNEFRKLWPSVGVLSGYILAIFFLTLSLRVLPVGIAYAIWAGMGIIFVALLGFLWHKQKLDIPAIIGLTCILAGVVLINLFSKSIIH